MADDNMEESELSQKQSQGSPDSRKRPLDGDGEDGVAKKSHYIPDLPGDGKFNLKILIPSIAAGAIIGKGGETIAQLQKDANARVKMSKSNDHYPGTNERVCLITGNVEAILEVLCFIIEKIKDKPEQNSKSSGDYEKSTERDKQIKILVPNSTAGMIIGKGGSYIKQIKEESGAYVQISQKAKDQSLAERCITVVSSDMENCQSACMMIIAKIVEDPQSGTCPNVSYSDMNGPVANPNPTGSPFANSPPHMSQLNNYGGGGGGGGMNNPLSAVGGLGNLLGGGVNLTLNLSSAYPGGGAGNPMVTGQLLDHVRGQLRGCGFADQCNAEVCQAISTLINYGIIGLGLGLSNMQGHHGGGQNMGGPPPLLGNSPGGDGGYHGPGSGGMNNGTSGPFGPIGTTVSSGLNLGQGLGGQGGSSQHRHDRFGSDGSFDPFRRQGNDMPPNGPGGGMPLNSNSFGLGTPRKSPSPGDGPDGKKIEMEVGEHIVGAIIGPGGKNLVEIQHISATSIQISKKGNYAPGTRNRVVTIAGAPSGITTAKFLIEQRINEEEAKRARQTNMAS